MNETKYFLTWMTTLPILFSANIEMHCSGSNGWRKVPGIGNNHQKRRLRDRGSEEKTGGGGQNGKEQTHTALQG